MSERKVYRLLAVGSALGPKEVTQLRSAPAPVQLADLQEIAKIRSAPERYHVCEALAEGRVRKARDARREWARIENGAEHPEDPAEAALRGLLAAWRRAPMGVRRRFVEVEFDQLSEMLASDPERGETF